MEDLGQSKGRNGSAETGKNNMLQLQVNGAPAVEFYGALPRRDVSRMDRHPEGLFPGRLWGMRRGFRGNARCGRQVRHIQGQEAGEEGGRASHEDISVFEVHRGTFEPRELGPQFG